MTARRDGTACSQRNGELFQGGAPARPISLERGLGALLWSDRSVHLIRQPWSPRRVRWGLGQVSTQARAKIWTAVAARTTPMSAWMCESWYCRVRSGVGDWTEYNRMLRRQRTTGCLRYYLGEWGNSEGGRVDGGTEPHGASEGIWGADVERR